MRQKQATYTETGWEVFPQGLTDTLVWIKQRYGDIPLYVTENGAALLRPAGGRRRPHRRPLRVDYFREHIGAIAAGDREQGVDLRGYFAWSLLDNLEWSLGYSKRFGIVHVDFETQERTPKAQRALLRRRHRQARRRVLSGTNCCEPSQGRNFAWPCIESPAQDGSAALWR